MRDASVITVGDKRLTSSRGLAAPVLDATGRLKIMRAITAVEGTSLQADLRPQDWFCAKLLNSPSVGPYGAIE